jgi:hypothetical protein
MLIVFTSAAYLTMSQRLSEQLNDPGNVIKNVRIVNFLDSQQIEDWIFLSKLSAKLFAHPKSQTPQQSTIFEGW